MKINFKPDKTEGDESVMSLESLNVREVRFHNKLREFHIITIDEPKYEPNDLKDNSWRSIKKLVIENGGTWKNKKEGIEFLLTL